MRRIKYKNKSFSDTEFKDILISDFLYFFPFIAKEDIGFDPSNPDIRYEKGGRVKISDKKTDFSVGGDNYNGNIIEIDGENAGAIAYDEGDNEIKGIKINTKFRRRGIAHSAIRELFKSNPKINNVYVRATPSAKKFWESVGVEFGARSYNDDAGLWEGHLNRKSIGYEKGGVANSESFKDWFKGSKVVDEKGNPLVVYHGTDKKRPFVGEVKGDIGIHFGTKKASADRLENLGIDGGDISAYYLSIKNLIRIRDVGAWADFKDVADELLKNGFISKEEYTVAEAFAKAQGVSGREHKVLVETLKSKGYDGFVYKNTAEDIGSDSYIVFDTSQIKEADFDPSNPDIRYEKGGKLIESREEFGIVMNMYEVGKSKNGNKTYKSITTYPDGSAIERFYKSDILGNKFEYKKMFMPKDETLLKGGDIRYGAGGILMDEKGEPKKFYRGTDVDGMKSKEESGALFFSPDINFAKAFAGETESSRIDEVILDVKEIFDYKNPEHLKRVKHIIDPDLYDGLKTGYWKSMEYLLEKGLTDEKTMLEEAGFDSMYVIESQYKPFWGRYMPLKETIENIVIINPDKQIKTLKSLRGKEIRYGAGGEVKEYRLNYKGGYNYAGQSKEVAHSVGLITLPKKVAGTNCSNCIFQKNKFCDHKKVLLPVTERMCCRYWDEVSFVSVMANILDADFFPDRKETFPLNAWGGYDYTGQALKRAKEADLITLPPDVLGTTCAEKNCLYGKNEGSLLKCVHPKVLLPVTDRMSCGIWDNEEVKRTWGKIEERFFEKGGAIKEKTKRVFVIHGWDGYPEECWFLWLKEKLEADGYNVSVPQMPEGEPQIAEWVSFISNLVGAPDDETYFVGHSIGCQAIMRYLETINHRAGGCIFVAGFFDLKNLETEQEKITAKDWIETPIDFEKVKSVGGEIIVILSDDDDVVDLEYNKEIFENKLSAKVIIEKGKGHFNGEDEIYELPIVLEQILRISGVGEVNENNYFQNTKGEFEIISKQEYDSIDVEEFVSEFQSRYKVQDGILYRSADHWGVVGVCTWNLKEDESIRHLLEGELKAGLNGYDEPIYTKIPFSSLSYDKDAVADDNELTKVWVSMTTSPARAGITPFIEVHPSLSTDDVKNVVSGKYPDYVYFKYKGTRHGVR